jgi:hypothetical protein
MAPQKGVKRAAAATRQEGQPAAKVLKEQIQAAEQLEATLKQHGVSKAKYNTIIGALENDGRQTFSDECRQMLKNSVLTSLCVAQDERHEIQTRLVEMIGTVIRETMEKLKEIAEKERSDSADVELAHKALIDAQAAAGQALTDGQAHTESQKAAFEEAQKASEAAAQVLGENQEAQRKGDEHTSAKTKERDAVAAALSTDLAAIVSGGEASGEPERKHVDSLVALATKLGLEDSLLEAMPSVLPKRPESRNSFDQMVLDQLSECLRKRVQDIESDLAAQGPATEERAAAVASAEAALEAAKGAQEQAAEALRVSEARRDELKAAKDAADKEVKNHLPQQKKVAKAVEKKQWDVDGFQIAVDIFEQLRDRSTKTAEAAPESMEPAEATPAEASVAGA